ncbi:hypothetical protein M378DRAFT_167029 [Amanita muscaria Koide BX008]|uniref:Uncharacterized protein n=1 Tax=Amanita muscaria (strain Koide BX008) TaxID=946122 RepID=A0A0C2SE99_AMAMK|nr:hypothetical protein M378DRAFT_167029 [Amanita muscaria Koide BX008]
MALFNTIVAGAPVTGRDVYVPPVTYPTVGTIWKAGGTYNVTWDTTNPPRQITNKMGRIVLAKAGRLQLDHTLALGFDILTGIHEVIVPRNITSGRDYQIVLFGDSGNSCAEFTIL